MRNMECKHFLKCLFWVTILAPPILVDDKYPLQRRRWISTSLGNGRFNTSPRSLLLKGLQGFKKHRATMIWSKASCSQSIKMCTNFLSHFNPFFFLTLHSFGSLGSSFIVAKQINATMCSCNGGHWAPYSLAPSFLLFPSAKFEA